MTNEALVNRIQRGEEVNASITALYENNLPFLRLMIRPYKIFYPEEDLLQDAYLGLYTAALKYDPDKEASFLVYAEHWIKQAVQRAIENTGDCLRVPVSRRQQVFQYRRIMEHYHQTGVKDKTLCDLLGVSLATLEKIRQADIAMQAPRSIDASLTLDGLTLSDIIESPEDFTEEILDRVEVGQLRKELERCLDELAEHEAYVIRQYYFEGRTLASIAQEMKKSLCRISEIKKQALLHLKQYHGDRLRPFWLNVCAIRLEPKSPPPEKGCLTWWKNPERTALQAVSYDAYIKRILEETFPTKERKQYETYSERLTDQNRIY